MQTPETICRWHELVASGDPAGLDELLAEDVVFHSPIVHKPQRGKALTQLYLGAAFQVLFSDHFRYVREAYGERHATLEFETEIDGIHINGVDWIAWDESGRIDDFKVWVRPLKAVNLLHQQMASMLQQLAPAKQAS